MQYAVNAANNISLACILIRPCLGFVFLDFLLVMPIISFAFVWLFIVSASNLGTLFNRIDMLLNAFEANELKDINVFFLNRQIYIIIKHDTWYSAERIAKKISIWTELCIGISYEMAELGNLIKKLFFSSVWVLFNDHTKK